MEIALVDGSNEQNVKINYGTERPFDLLSFFPAILNN